MRRTPCALLALAALAAGCLGDEPESTTPLDVNDSTPADTNGTAGLDTTGCTGNGVGSGTGDITADRACPTNETNASNASV